MHGGFSGRLRCYHSDMLSGVILKQIIYTDCPLWPTVGCQSKSQGTRYQILSGADCLRYCSGQDFQTILQYRLIDSSPSRDSYNM